MKKILVLALPVVLLAGCRSEQVVFRFQPAPAAPLASAKASTQASAQTPAALPVESAKSGASISVAPAPASAGGSVQAAAATAAARPRRPTRSRPPGPAAPSYSDASTVVDARSAPAAPSRRLTQALLRRPATEGAAEAGLGRTVLFIVGVVLGAVAGLAALLSLLPGVSFWGGLGLAVGGLVVLGLLYRLVSGSGKKK